MVMTSPCALDVSWLLVHPNPASSAGRRIHLRPPSPSRS